MRSWAYEGRMPQNGRPGQLCPLCFDSKYARSFTVQECATCRGRHCARHIQWYQDQWTCNRCVRNAKKKAAKK